MFKGSFLKYFFIQAVKHQEVLNNQTETKMIELLSKTIRQITSHILNFPSDIFRCHLLLKRAFRLKRLFKYAASRNNKSKLSFSFTIYFSKC